MQRKFKHKITGDIVKERQNKDCRFYTNEIHSIPALFVENSNDWQEIQEIPVGTKVVDADTRFIYEKLQNGKWFLDRSPIHDFTISESSIGEGKRFQIVKEVKKDWEILSFEGVTASRLLWTKQKNGLFSVNCSLNKLGTHSEEYLLQEGLKIQSVKRLSDNEVFQIGDTVKTTQLTFVIEKFSINVHRPSEILLSSSEHTFICNLNEVFKSKPILFTTEDNIGIKKGDLYYFVIDSKVEILNPWTVKSHVCNWDTLTKSPLGHVQFSKKEAAEDWIILNKPCLSYLDVHLAIQRTSVDYKTKAFLCDKIKELVKSKQ
jgi:hypothetical protein